MTSRQTDFAALGRQAPLQVDSAAPTPWLAAKRWYDDVAALAAHVGTRQRAVDLGAGAPIDLTLVARFVLSRRLENRVEESRSEQVKYVRLRRRSPDGDQRSRAAVEGDWFLRVTQIADRCWAVETLCRSATP